MKFSSEYSISNQSSFGMIDPSYIYETKNFIGIDFTKSIGKSEAKTNFYGKVIYF